MLAPRVIYFFVAIGRGLAQAYAACSLPKKCLAYTPAILEIGSKINRSAVLKSGSHAGSPHIHAPSRLYPFINAGTRARFMVITLAPSELPCGRCAPSG